ncbi:chondroitin sulfate proteoglycan 4 [Engraulis encrasicolus]|uniref:chondroitin sulfate proteoglycan 4 n=1 Tax=Engraulis encrasicolus TaxID=184585 RepID=UPI002FD55FA0
MDDDDDDNDDNSGNASFYGESYVQLRTLRTVESSERTSLYTCILYLLLISYCILFSSSTASFYGDGYVQLRTVESSERTSLHVRFRTSYSSGVLFLAAGETDYCLVELQSGRVQVTLDLGSGVRSLRSEKGVQLDDLVWHTMELEQDRHNVQLTVDKYSQTSLRMPGPDLELSVQEGLFVGGLGDLRKSYLPADGTAAISLSSSSSSSSYTGFRGCLDEVLFNEHNLLSSLRPYSGYKRVHEVSFGCSSEFSASADEPVHFFSSRAFLALPMWDVPQEGIFECELHQSAQDGIVLYSSANDGYYVAMELTGGHVVATVGSATAKTELRCPLPEDGSEGEWNLVRMHLSAVSVHLVVGGDIQNASLGLRTNALQLSGPLFVGGVDSRTRVEAKQNELASLVGKQTGGGGSIRGCMRNIRVNAQKTGLPSALVTKDISDGCEIDTSPFDFFTTPNPNTDQDVFQVKPPRVECKRGESYLALEDLVVPEGGRAPLGPRHVRMTLDLQSFGLDRHQIMIRIEEQPVHGQLRLDVGPDQEDNTFSLLDLWRGRVMYVHGGSEDPADFFTFSVFGNSKRQQLPACMRGNNKLHRLNVSVAASNDAPEISLPEGNLLTVLEESKRQLTTDTLRVSDPDSTDLMVSLLGTVNTDAGYLEIDTEPGQAIRNFSYLHLEQGRVYYVHAGVKNSRIALRVSDGEKVSNTVVLRVTAVRLEYRVVNNTGVEVTQGGWAVLGSKHLAVQVNVAQQVGEVRYDVVEPPQYGELQRLFSNGEWKHTWIFTQKLLEKERIRYLSTHPGSHPGNVTDSFRFRVSIGSMTTEEMLFSIVVQGIHYKVMKSKMQVNAERRVAITSQDLRAVSKGMKIPDSELYFLVLSLPKKGHLILDKKVLGINGTFSQKNISDEKLVYEMLDEPLADMRDSFTFLVFSKYSYSANHDFRFLIKASTQSIVLTNFGLNLIEGDSKVITRDDLFSETNTNSEVVYKVTNSPKYGKLATINLSDSATNNENISLFSNQDILNGRLMYVHDGSETTYDEFSFIASVISSDAVDDDDDEDNVVKGIFKISIQLDNDEKPVRVVDKVFHVAKNGQRLITLEDLCYNDADSDFDSGQLIYTRRSISLGEIVLANDTTQKLYQFRQKDMEEKRILFVHNGPSYGRFVLFVSDGRHYVSTILEVIAQDPYIKVATNTGLLVRKGSEVVLSLANFSVSSNLDIRDDQEVTFDLFLPPKHGRLTCQGARTKAFTLQDIKAGDVVYEHNDGSNPLDVFNFTVRAKGLQLDASVVVKVFLESHQQPPTILRNNPILVEAKKPVKITRKDLEVAHKDNAPTEIVFRVKKPPSNGFLRRSVGQDEPYQGTQERPIRSFTQEDVNDQLVQYVHVGSDQAADTFLVDISNSLTVISDVIITMEVIPQHIPLQVVPVTLSEGASRALTKDIIQVTSAQFKGLNFLYQVTEYPNNGQIENWRFPGVAIPTFTRVQAEHGFIQYVHDGSESLVDSFTLVANDTVLRRHSLPCVVHVNITPINDEVPTVTVNNILKVWVGSITEITVDDLNAEDKDSRPEQLEFIVTPPTNGHLALKAAPSRPILNFTQAHILANQLLFIHTGALSGGFHFQVNDGLNFAEREMFATMARTLELSLERNLVLKLFPGTLKAITDDHLLVVTNDFNDITGNRDITFTVTNPPKLGRLVRVMEDNSTKEISSFTQNMVNDEEIMYAQTDTDALGWKTKDSFTFTVLASPASLQPQTFSIEISYDNAGPEQTTILLANTGAVVPEGGRVVIDKSKLDASNLLRKVKEPKKKQLSYEVWYRVTSLPNYGVIVVEGQNLTTDNADFSQVVVDQDGVTYTHDDSENFYDYFSFDVWLNPKGTVAKRPQDMSEVVSETFSITVTAVNDQPPVIRTLAPVLKVVHGDLVTLTSENLHVEDQDTPPEDIQYTVTSRPESGLLFLSNNRNESAPVFTQGDVNSGRVHFIQDGDLSHGVFNFSVTDGVHQPLSKHLRVEVEQVSITMVNSTGLTLRQGQSSVVLTSKHLAAITNKRNASITYYITQQPRYGAILKDGQKVVQFDDEDLRSATLSYNMTELSVPEDSFECTLSLPEVNLTSQRVNITVRPLIAMNHHVRIPSGVAVKLRRIVLDAGELAALSRSDPVFEIVSPPRYGRLLKFGQSGSMKLVKSFTFQDVIQGRVAIEESNNLTGLQGNVPLSNTTKIHHLKDSFAFLLTAPNVQPARGEFVFNVVPYKPMSRMPAITSDPSRTTEPPPAFNNTIQDTSPQHPVTGREHNHTRSHKHRHKSKGRSRSGGHTTHWHNRPPGSTAPKTTSGQQHVNLTNVPVFVESMPRPASDPLLIILPFLACLLLIVILIIMILVFRHRREKRAAQQSAVRGRTAPTATGRGRHGEDQSETRSPCLGTPERSVAMPSVVVTPVRCRANAEFVGAVAPPGMGPHDPQYILCAWTPVEPEIVLEDQARAPPLGVSQYWV